MSAFIAVALDDSVEILTDGASVRDDGTLVLASQKVHTYPEARMAYTGRGNVGATMMVNAMLLRFSQCGTFDETAELFETELRAGLPAIRGHAIDGLLAGLSETRGPVLLYFRTLATDGAPEAFRLHQTDRFFGMGPTVPDERYAEAGILERATTEPFWSWGLDIMDIWRRHPMEHFNAGGHLVFGVGAHVDHTLVGADGCETYRLASWPDRVGAKIDPLRATAVA